MNILHPIKSLEQWALQRLLKRIAEELPVAKQQLAQLWEQHKDEIAKKVTEAIKKTVTNIIKKAIDNTKA